MILPLPLLLPVVKRILVGDVVHPTLYDGLARNGDIVIVLAVVVITVVIACLRIGEGEGEAALIGDICLIFVLHAFEVGIIRTGDLTGERAGE